MTWTRHWIQNLTYALRITRKAPGWTAASVVTLTLGIGATLAMYTLVDHVLVRPLPWADAGRLVRLYQHDEQKGLERNSVSLPNFLDWRDSADSFETLAAWTSARVTLNVATGDPERLEVTRVSAELFDLLRVSPALGRSFEPPDNEPGRHRVVLLSEAVFAGRFGSDPRILGSSVRLDGEPHEVIGVMPRGFGFPEAEEPLLWTPIAYRSDASRGAQFYQVLGRLRAGVGMVAARAEMEAIARRYQDENPGDPQFTAISLFGLHDDQVRDVRSSLWLLLAAVGFLLLIACLNVSHLLLARLHDRRRELAVRTALGATRRQLVGQMLAEAVLLAAPSAALGLLAAQWALDAVLRFLPEALPGLDAVSIDGRIVAFTLILTVSTVVVFAMLPALSGTRELETSLRDATSKASAGRDRSRFGRFLIVGEVTLAVMLVAGAGLLIRSLGEMITLDPGFSKQGTTAVRIGLPEVRYDTLEKSSRFYDQVLERLRATPGVTSASAVGWLPLGGIWSCSFDIEGHTRAAGEPAPSGVFRPVGTGYFRTLGIPLKRGRTFSPADHADSEKVIVIDEALAAKYFRESDPLGRRMIFHCGDGDDARTIVGVVGNVRQYRLTEDFEPGYYIPYSQLHWDTMSLVFRATVDPAPIVGEIRGEVARLDPELAVYGVETMENRLSRALVRPRLQSLLLGGFAVLGLALGAAGVYGVMACSVARRRHEMGIRAALGARRRDLVRLVLGEGMSMAVAGLAVGLVLTLAVSRLLESLLFGVSATDPGTLAAAAAVLGAVALVACALPARRAGSVDVVHMLRTD